MKDAKKQRMDWECKIIRLRIMCKEYCESPYRREREYGGYLKRWFETEYDPKEMTEPMPYNIYMMG